MRVNTKKIVYLVTVSKTNGKLDSKKITFIAKKLLRNELVLYHKLLIKQRDEEKVRVFTAIDMPSELAKQFIKMFQQKDVFFEKDANLLAGMKVKFSDFMFDASFASHFEKLKKDISN